MESIASFAHYILEEIDPDYDPSESYIGKTDYYSSSKSNDGLCKCKIYSHEGLQLSDGDLYFLKNNDIVYLDLKGNPFNFEHIIEQYDIA